VADYLNWITLFGIGMIVGGIALIVIAISSGRRLRAAEQHAPPGFARRPNIRPSALLADTASLADTIGQRSGEPAREPADR
jgi:hypothetical protein